jgi:hypothetical protein
LFEVFPAALGAFGFLRIVLSDTEDDCKLLLAFGASIIVAGHLLSLPILPFEGLISRIDLF